jgi:hypothetical protein
VDLGSLAARCLPDGVRLLPPAEPVTRQNLSLIAQVFDQCHIANL